MKKSLVSPYRKQSGVPSLTTNTAKTNLLIDAANAWNWTARRILVMWGVPFVISLAAIVAGIISKDFYAWLVTEDGLFEYLAVGFLTLVFIGSLRVSLYFFKTQDKLLAFLFAGLSLAMFFMVGEELGWGQRIFGWQTPESFSTINKQSETTLHNIYGVEEMFKWLQMLAGAYGTLLPLVTLFVRIRGRLGEIVQRVIPHYSIIPYFAFIFFWKIFRAVYPNPKSYEWAITEFNEVTELILAIGLFLFVIFQLRSLKVKTKQPVHV